MIPVPIFSSRRATLAVATFVFALTALPDGVWAGGGDLETRPDATQRVSIRAVSVPTGNRPLTNEAGVRLLEAELVPAKTTLAKAKCELLVAAVGATTLAHPEEARAILWAALTRRVIVLKKKDEPVATLPCTCARRIVLASIAAAPKQASEFLDLAAELYPDCVAELAEAVKEYDDSQTPTGGFGVGFGPGFPGSPGFTGSPPAGAIALPPAVVTAVLNG